MVNLIGTILGFILTLAVFSYLIGDNGLFRIAIYIFIGASAGYVLSVAIFNIILPQIFLPLVFGTIAERALVLVPLLLGGMLLTKISARLSYIGSIPMAFLVGAGAAAAVGGALQGTLFPQLNATISNFDNPEINLLDGLVMLIGTVSTLIYFNFRGKKPGASDEPIPVVLQTIGGVGQVFVAVAFGTIFAGVYSAALGALIERLQFLWNVIQPYLPFA